MTTAIAMDIARPPAAAARLRSGRFRASSRRASRFATPRASSGADLPRTSRRTRPFAWSSSAAASAASPPASRFVALASTRTSTSAPPSSARTWARASRSGRTGSRRSGASARTWSARWRRAAAPSPACAWASWTTPNPKTSASLPLPRVQTPRRRRLPRRRRVPQSDARAPRRGISVRTLGRRASRARVVSSAERHPPRRIHRRHRRRPFRRRDGGRSVRLRATRRIGRHRRRPRHRRRARRRRRRQLRRPSRAPRRRAAPR